MLLLLLLYYIGNIILLYTEMRSRVHKYRGHQGRVGYTRYTYMCII